MKVSFNLTAAGILVATALVAGSATARADRRAYGETYEAVTASQGELDVEAWTTYARLGEVDGGPASRGVRQMIELEYGITDRWDVALYNMLDVIGAGDTASGYAGFKIESRYRPSSRGQWFVDPVFYVEAAERLRGDASQSLEGKLILAKDFRTSNGGNVNTALNLAFEGERLADHSLHPEYEWAFGTSYSSAPRLAIGAEAFGKSEPAMGGGYEHRVWAGPSISFAASTRGGHRGVRQSPGDSPPAEDTGGLHGVWVTLAGGAGLTSQADAFYARMVIGLQF